MLPRPSGKAEWSLWRRRGSGKLQPKQAHRPARGPASKPSQETGSSYFAGPGLRVGAGFKPALARPTRSIRLRIFAKRVGGGFQTRPELQALRGGGMTLTNITGAASAERGRV